MRRCPVLLAVLLALALIAAACGDDGEDGADGGDTPTESPDDEDDGDGAEGDTDVEDVPEEETVAADFAVHVSAGQVTVTGGEPGTELELRGGPGEAQTGTVDELGNLLFRQVEPGTGWQVFDRAADPTAASDAATVPTLDEHPDQAFYSAQQVPGEFSDETGAWQGYTYIETRDGTLLAATVRLPGPPEEGPYPTVVEYSGYDPASPYEIEPAIQIYGQLGWATVGVNMRGSGCSGGAFDYFEPLQTIDGYDVIEAIAAQDWVYENKVGMVGISYSGISQLFVAQTQPPSLAAITPISVIEDSYRSVVYPGGIYNNGFAKSWGDSRQGANDAYGQEWVNQRIDEGDTVCDENQLLRSQNQDLAANVETFEYYPETEAEDWLSPRLFVDRITVPTFLAGAWQDEQTGGRFPTMLDDFTGTDVFHAHVYNGAHADSLGPASLLAATEILDVYVADRVPLVDPIVRFGAPLLYEAAFGVAASVPDDRFSTYDEAKAALEAGPTVTVFLENGGNPDALGAPVPRGQVVFDGWPAPGAEARTWSLADLTGGESVGEFIVDVAQSQELTKAADDDGDEFENLDWQLLEAGEALVFETDAFTEDLLLLGSGRVSLAVMADEADADLEVTISEVRPDGYEMYVQSGWLRASHRALDEDQSSETLPWHRHTESATADLPPGEFTQVDVAVFPAGHVFRAGSKLRLIVDSPGGNRNLWAFDVLPNDGTAIRVDPAASSLTLPFVAGLDVPEGLSDCEHTRSQPCRMWVAYDNGVVTAADGG